METGQELQGTDNTQEAPKGRGSAARTLERAPNGRLLPKGEKRKSRNPYQRKKLLEKYSLDDALAMLKAGTLNRSSLAGKQYEVIQGMLEYDPKSTVIQLIKNDISTYAVICKAIVDYYQAKNGKIKIVNGELPIALSKDLPRFHDSMIKNCERLLRLLGNPASKVISECEQDLSDMVLGLSNSDNTELTDN